MKNNELWTKFENHCLNEGLSRNRMKKLKMVYGLILRGFDDHNLDELTRTDIETFVNKLNRNEFKATSGTNYSGSSKSDVKKFLKQFWKWLKGDNEIYPPEVAWIKARISKDEKPIEKEVLSLNDTIRLANGFSRIEYKLLTLLLFDSGFRIQEMLSVKKKDLTWEEYAGEKKCFWMRCNLSKTYVRKIPVPLFTEDIQAFVNSTYFKGLASDSLLFVKGYATVRKILCERAVQVLGRKLSPHLFRHSSATYYARELEGDTLKLAHRYGWSLGSDEMKTYVRMSGAYERASVKKVYENETVKLKERITELEEELNNQRLKMQDIGLRIKEEILLELKEKVT
ncbi:site-specific integrase [Candidatus Woesearchaeota archaeon]|nr:site-specific integrase [Candidatus Woesearchaeota archaeon]